MSCPTLADQLVQADSFNRAWDRLCKLMQSAEATGSPGSAVSAQSLAGNDLRAYLPLQLLLIGLTFVTGILDAVTYLDLGHVFVANMTGNFVLLGLGLLRADDLALPASLTAVAGFVIGAAGGGRFVRWFEPRGQRWLVSTLSVVICLLLLALLAATYRLVIGDYTTIVLLACAMGLTNATADRIGIPGLTTTIVITNTLTNLVSGTQLPHGDAGKRVRQASAVAALVVGAVAGGALLRLGAVVAIGTAVAVVLIGMAAYSVTSRGQPRNPRRAMRRACH